MHSTMKFSIHNVENPREVPARGVPISGMRPNGVVMEGVTR